MVSCASNEGSIVPAVVKWIAFIAPSHYGWKKGLRFREAVTLLVVCLHIPSNACTVVSIEMNRHVTRLNSAQKYHDDR